jgi:protein TonB
MVARKAAHARVHDQIKAAIGVAALHALLGYALIHALGIEIPTTAQRSLKLFEVAPEPPPPVEKPVPDRPKSDRREGAASPPNLKAVPAPIVAPEPPIPLIVPRPVIAAPTPGAGGDPSAGGADVSGPGTGGGGEGRGSGGGGTGAGDGDYTPPERIRGRLKDSDYPRAAGESGIGKTMTVRFTVEASGRVGECAVIESSGNAILDDATCRAIARRYRYEPSRDADGTAVPSTVVQEHTWLVDDR